MSKNAKLREKHKWAIEKPKLDNARRLRGIYFIESDDIEFKEIFKKMQVENWKCQWLPPCLARHARKARMVIPVVKLIISSLNLHVSFAVSESTRMRMEESLSKFHEDHIARKGDISVQHNNLVTQIHSYASRE